MAEAPPCCNFCPADEHVKATHTYTDPQGNVWRLCQKHFEPIGRFLTKQGKAKEAV